VLWIIKNAYAKLKNWWKYLAVNSNIGEFHGYQCFSYKIEKEQNLKEWQRTITYLRIGKGEGENNWHELNDYFRSIKTYIKLFEEAGFFDVKVEKYWLKTELMVELWTKTRSLQHILYLEQRDK